MGANLNITVSAYQGNALYDEIEKSITVIHDVMKWAEDNNVDILCFPECFLQGYILDESKALKVSMDLNSPKFAIILKSLYSSSTTVILGLIERDRDHLYNTAIVIEKGKLVGTYRKHFIHNKETVFTCGTDFPVFEKNGIKYGINICYDSRFPESAQALVKQGAQIIFCPLNNSLPHAKADEWRDKHLQYFVDKAKMSGCWIVSADVVEQSQTNTGFGCTCLVSPEGEVTKHLEELKVGKFKRQLEFESVGAF